MSTSLNEYFTEWIPHWRSTSLKGYFTERVLHWMSTSLKEYFTVRVLHWMSISLNEYFTEWVLCWMSTSLNENFTEWVLHWMSTSQNEYLPPTIPLTVQHAALRNEKLWNQPSHASSEVFSITSHFNCINKIQDNDSYLGFPLFHKISTEANYITI